jgi:carboxynorspermidine decarboxylase
VFEDMALYTIVKNNTFNGLNLPSIYALGEDGKAKLLKEFGYEDFFNRLG